MEQAHHPVRPTHPTRTGRRARRALLAAALLACLGTPALASHDWSAAERKADEFDRHADELMKEAVSDTKKIVERISSATDERRKSEAESAVSSARSHINDKFNSLEREKREAIEALEAVDREDKQHDRDARDKASKVKSKWDKINDSTRALRDGRPPVAEFMISRSESARRDHMDRCDAKDVSISFDKAECVKAHGETCAVVAVTANNSSAISAGRDHARRAADALNEELKKPSSDVIKHLIDRRSDFKQCKRFEAQVDCFSLKPDIRDDGRNSEPSPDWHERC